MLRRVHWILTLALLACASVAHADAMRLLAPTGGATLHGGSFVDLRWSATQLPPDSEEWEAFLSVDGGKYYAFRVTPHLDIDRQHFTFLVPNVDTHDARILIRTGNEQRETLYEIPATFTIVRDASVEEVLPRITHSGRGEAARDGDPNVLEWESGTGRQSSATTPSKSFGRRGSAAEHELSILSVPAAKHATILAIESAPLVPYAERATRNTQPVRFVDFLLICSRRNV